MRSKHVLLAALVALSTALQAEPSVKVSDSGPRPVKNSKGQMIVFHDVTLDTGKVKFMLRMGNGAIGVRRPSAADFYQSGAFYIGAAGQRYFKAGKLMTQEEYKAPFETKVEQAEGSATLVATQKKGDVTVEVRLKAAAGADHLEMTVAVTGQKPKDAMAIRFITYPSAFVRKGGHKFAVLSSGETEENIAGKAGAKAKTSPSDHWVYLRDKTLDAKKQAGLGISWNPAEIKSWNTGLGSYASKPLFMFSGPKTTFKLWEFVGATPDEALARMKQIPAPPKN